jgi:hypothetical protein
MSPLGYLLLKFMKYGVGFCAGCLGIYLAVLIWDRWLASAPLGLGGTGTLPVLFIAGCFLGAMWLFRAISRELKMGAPPR